MLRFSKENEYPYSESDVQKILHKLFEKGLIGLSESKHPEKVGRTDDPKYCEYHRIIGPPIEKCNAFRGQVLQLVKEGKITFDGEETEESDLSSMKITSKWALGGNLQVTVKDS